MIDDLHWHGRVSDSRPAPRQKGEAVTQARCKLRAASAIECRDLRDKARERERAETIRKERLKMLLYEMLTDDQRAAFDARFGPLARST